MNWKFTYSAYRLFIYPLFMVFAATTVLSAKNSLINNEANEQFGDITVSKQKNIVTVTWSVSGIQKNVYYEIERAGYDMIFKTAGILFPEEKAGPVNFRFNDNLRTFKKVKTLYYRVKQVNANGSVIYSLIKEVAPKEKKPMMSAGIPLTYDTVNNYSYCAEKTRVKNGIKNMMAGILMESLVNLKNFSITKYQPI